MRNFLRWEGLSGEINQFEDMCRSVKFGVVDLEYFFVQNVFVAAWANKDDC